MSDLKLKEKSTPKVYCHYLDKWYNADSDNSNCYYKDECPRVKINSCVLEKNECKGG